MADDGEPVLTNGSKGEGGGQVLRTSLTLSLITGSPLHMTSIRANRPKPGLRPQHLQCVRASTKISAGKCVGANKGSMEIEFTPGGITAGNYDFSIGTAGSTSLLLQALLPPLALAGGGKLTLSGGTHVEWAPVFDYLEAQYFPFLEKLGLATHAKLLEAGFYPRGGGRISVEVEPAKEVSPLTLTERGNLLSVSVTTVVANLKLEIAQRMSRHALKLLRRADLQASDEIRSVSAFSPGICLVIAAEFENTSCCYTALGRRGKRAEKVAAEAVDKLLAFLESDAAVDEYTGDQLLVPLALADGESRFTTAKVTNHLLTNAATIRKFLPVRITIDGELDSPGTVTVSKKGLKVPAAPA